MLRQKFIFHVLLIVLKRSLKFRSYSTRFLIGIAAEPQSLFFILEDRVRLLVAAHCASQDIHDGEVGHALPQKHRTRAHRAVDSHESWCWEGRKSTNFGNYIRALRNPLIESTFSSYKVRFPCGSCSWPYQNWTQGDSKSPDLVTVNRPPASSTDTPTPSGTGQRTSPRSGLARPCS